MAPKVAVPMDFGRRLRDSPTHNTLEINTSEGGKVFASPVILSFNSPVIDHMTTTLHFKSVDMLQFSKAAVEVFVDAAYSGSAVGLNNYVFRDLNKMANVFEMTWLVQRCSEYFNRRADSIKQVDSIFPLFEEAAFALENIKSKSFLDVTIKKIESLQCKRLFLKTYLEEVDADKFTITKLDMLIEIAGQEVHYLIQSVADQLTLSKSMNNSGSTSLSFSSCYLLENCDICSCRALEPELFCQLFDLLGKLPNEKMKWTLDLYRKAVEKPSSPGEETIASCSRSSMTSIKKTSNMIPNLNLSDLNLNMPFSELLIWLTTSREVSSLLLAIEAVIAWGCQGDWYNESVASTYMKNEDCKFDEGRMKEIERILCRLTEKRNWSLLPEGFLYYDYTVSLPTPSDPVYKFSRFNLRPYYCLSGRQNQRCVITDCIEDSLEPLKVLSTENKLRFRFRHPSITKCNQTGYCGFILKTVPCESGYHKMRLCTEEADYATERVHFHEETQAEKMHVFFHEEYLYDSEEVLFEYTFYPISWLAKSPIKGKKFDVYARFRVLYYLTNDDKA